jgi:PHP family Zn ribbon phosphoesterase
VKRFVADLHVHTLLSPCAEVEMTPRNIMLHAVEYGIDIVAITDHNACENVASAIKAAQGLNVTVLPGMEVETKEEVHMVVLFDHLSQLALWEGFVNEHRTNLLNDETRFGAQFIVDEKDEFVAVKPEMLLASLTCSAAEVSAVANELGGICIAGHIDRPAYSILSQLGFVPPDVKLAACEVSKRTKAKMAREVYPAVKDLPIISSSDAHTMEDFIGGPKTIFYMEAPVVSEIEKALSGRNSRKVVVAGSWQGAYS